MKNPVLKIKKLYAEVQEAFHLVRTTAAGIELLFTSIEKINKRQDIIVEALAVLRASVANNNKAVNDKLIMLNDKLDIIHSIIAEPLRNKDLARKRDLPEQIKHLENPAFS